MECIAYLEVEAGLSVAIRFAEKAEESFAYIAEYPKTGELLQVNRRVTADMRLWRVNDFEKYLIFYLSRQGGQHSGVEIVRVGHSAQNWMKILGIK